MVVDPETGVDASSETAGESGHLVRPSGLIWCWSFRHIVAVCMSRAVVAFDRSTLLDKLVWSKGQTEADDIAVCGWYMLESGGVGSTYTQKERFGRCQVHPLILSLTTLYNRLSPPVP